MRRTIVVAVLLLTIALPLSSSIKVSAQNQGKALIMSSLESILPMGYEKQIERYLKSSGYEVTFVHDRNVTLNFLTTQLNNYDIVIWRTNTYSWMHVTYMYVGEISNTATLQAYANEFASGAIDNTNGILGVSETFFHNHFPQGSLTHIKLAILVSSSSFSLAMIMISAGVKSIIDYYGTFSLTLDLIDYITDLVVAYLANGTTVKDSVWNTITRFLNQSLEDPIDSSYLPPIWWMGDSTFTIK